MIPPISYRYPPPCRVFSSFEGGASLFCRILKKSSRNENFPKNPTVFRSKTASQPENFTIEYIFGKHIYERFSLEMLAIWMFQNFFKSDIFCCLYFGAGFFFSNFGFCNIGFGFSSLSSFRARFGTGISASVFAATWNMKYRSSSSTRFSRRAYMARVVPSLMMTMALRHAFDIPGGEGRIQNVDVCS